MVVASLPANRRTLSEPSVKRSLASILRDRGPLGVREAVDIALDVCDELANAHAHGIVHGDLGLHRVRILWPRVEGERADIFALDENDSGAFAFRASSSVGSLVSPEQRDGRSVDVRADVWAVGAMLHWMITGLAPGPDPLERTLSKAPRSLVIAISSCLAESPVNRPQSVNELAELLASFASSPPARFEQLARRRAALESPSRIVGDVDGVLGRLDDAALARELAEATPADRLMFAVHRTTGAIDAPVRVTEMTEAPTIDAKTTEVARSRPKDADREMHSVLPLVTTPPVFTSALLAPPKPEVVAAMDAAAAAPRVEPLLPTVARAPSRRPSSSWKTALAGAGAVLAVAFGALIGMRAVEHFTDAPSPARSTTITAAAVTATTTLAPPRAGANPRQMTPNALPDARPATPASLPDAKPATKRQRRSKAQAASTTSAMPATTGSVPTTSDGEEPVKGFKSFDSTPSASADAPESPAEREP